MACLEPNCGAEVRIQGYCKKHYYRARRHGVITLLKGSRPSKTMAEKLRGKHIVDRNGCWIWQGRFDAYGYGSLMDERTRNIKAHRVSYQVNVGPIPERMEVMHKCDNPPCICPDHLVLGTHAENMADMMRKRRNALGERNGKAILNCTIVREIREAYASGQSSQAELARKHGVDASTISRAVTRDNWPSVE